MIYNSNYNFIFIHIPKNAGTSISEYFEDRIPGSERLNFPKHIEAKYLKEQFEHFGECELLTSIRNPWARLWSFYNYVKIKIPQLHEKNLAYIRKPDADEWLKEKLVTSRIPWQEQMIQDLYSKGFNTWVVDNIFDRVTDNVPVSRKSQLDYIKDHDGTWLIPKKNCLKIDDGQISSRIERFLLRYGDMEWYPYPKFIAREILSVQPLSFPHKHEMEYKSYKEVYNDEAKAHVAKYFEEDIDEFGYTFDL